MNIKDNAKQYSKVVINFFFTRMAKNPFTWMILMVAQSLGMIYSMITLHLVWTAVLAVSFGGSYILWIHAINPSIDGEVDPTQTDTKTDIKTNNFWDSL